MITGAPQSDGSYNVQLQGSNAAGPGTVSTLVLDVVAEPPGADSLANATGVGGIFVRSQGTNQFASAEPGEPVHAGTAAGASIWWSWTAPISGTVTIDTFGSAIDTVLSVYLGDSFGTLTSVAENDDVGKNTASAVTLKVQAGDSYLIAVDRRTAETGSIILNIGYKGSGGYQGLITDVNNVEMPGLAAFKLTDKFKFTAKIVFEGKKYSLKGEFTGENFSGDMSRGKSLPAIPVTLKLNLDPGAEEIIGTLVDGATTYTFTARHDLPKTDVPADVQGKYTFVIEPDEVAPELPGGFGYGTASIDKSGKAKVVGTLGDGTRFSCSTTLATDHSFVLFALPYRAGGVVATDISVQPGARIFPPLSGSPDWRKAADSKSKSYAAGFTTTTRFKGYPFVKLASNATILTLSLPSDNLEVSFDGGDMVPAPDDFIGSLITKNKFIGGPDKFSLKFSTGTGLFSGKIIDGAKKTHKIGGAVLSYTVDSDLLQNRGVGLFFGTSETGSIELTPVPLVPPVE